METIRKIFAIIAIYCLFLALMWLFLKQAVALDEYVFFTINSFYLPLLFSFFNLITYIGSSVFWLLLVVIFWLKKKRKLSLQLFIAFILDTVAVLFLKNIFLRPRPFEKFQFLNSIDFDIGPSFPSGHSERAFSGAVILSSYYKKYKVAFFILAFLVSLSRIYIGFHYPLDAFIGSINGIILGIIILEIPLKKIKKYL